ncbi:MAG: hypothetical protein LQ340_005536 [Diploschistes diacapsis]|nr:MAG: hypothetical protein LQ340_005536 [Diploschistes diacapsis]
MALRKLRSSLIRYKLELPWIPDHEIGMWHKRISGGNVDALFALLLCYLHNLRELRIQRPILIPMTSVVIGRLKSSIVESITCDSSSFADFLLSPPEPLALDSYHSPPGLSRLERVIIDPAVSASDTHPRHRLGDFARFACFSSLPSLQHLNGISLVSRKYNLDQTFTGFSGLRSIRLVNCHVAPEALHSLFAGIRALESFHYTPATTSAQAKDFRLTPIVEDLKRYAARSLMRLYLRHSHIETRSEAWKYRAFEQLKKVDLDWRCLVHHEPPPRPSSSSAAAPTTLSSFKSSNFTVPAPLPPPSNPLAPTSAAAVALTSIPAAPTGAPPKKIHHPPLVDTLPRSIESLKLVDTDGEANLETVRWIFFRLVMQRAARLPHLKIVIFVTPRRDCWLHAKDICTRAGLKYPSYGVERERKIRELNFVYE